MHTYKNNYGCIYVIYIYKLPSKCARFRCKSFAPLLSPLSLPKFRAPRNAKH